MITRRVASNYVRKLIVDFLLACGIEEPDIAATYSFEESSARMAQRKQASPKRHEPILGLHEIPKTLVSAKPAVPIKPSSCVLSVGILGQRDIKRIEIFPSQIGKHFFEARRARELTNVSG